MTCELRNLSVQLARLPSHVFDITRKDGAIPFHQLTAYLSEKTTGRMRRRTTRFQTRVQAAVAAEVNAKPVAKRRQSEAVTGAGDENPEVSRRRTRSVTVGCLEALEDECVLPLRRRRTTPKSDSSPLCKRRRVRSSRSEVSTPTTTGEDESSSTVSSAASTSQRATRLRSLYALRGRSEQVRKRIFKRLESSVTDQGDSTIADPHDNLGSDSSSSKRSTMNSAQGSGNSSCRSDKNVEELGSFVKKSSATSDGKKQTRQRRSPLAPLGCGCAAEEESPRPRSRPSTPRCASSPLESSVSAFPRKRRQRFRLLRTKKVEWDESASQTTLDLEQSPLVRSGGKSRLVNCRQLVLEKAKQSEPIAWSELLSGMAKENFVYLGEGDFAEVYRYSVGKQCVVLKVMAAVDDDDCVAPAEIKGYSHYLPEIVASKMITRLSFKYHSNRTHGFAKLIGIDVVKGRLPKMLWELKSSSGYPVDDTFYTLPSSQEWLVLKYPYLGKSLDSISLLELPASAMRSIVAQVALSLAAGEHVFQFEHRDLHMGNVLLQKVRFDRFRYRVDNENFSVPSEGYSATIIDYSLARVTDEDGEVYFVDFEDDEQDSSEELPDHLSVHYKTKEMNQNRWDVYNPYSNILWLKYMCEKFREALNGLPMGERMRKRNDNTHRAISSELTVLLDSMPGYRSCSELVRANFYFDAFRNSGGD